VKNNSNFFITGMKQSPKEEPERKPFSLQQLKANSTTLEVE
jgi:hypothetical protein